MTNRSFDEYVKNGEGMPEPIMTKAKFWVALVFGMLVIASETALPESVQRYVTIALSIVGPIMIVLWPNKVKELGTWTGQKQG